jgi:hypothetical protein
MDSAAPTKDRRRRFPNWLKTVAGILIAGSAFYFLGSRLVRDWSEIPRESIHFRPWLFALSLLPGWLLDLPATGLAWTIMLRKFGDRLQVRHSIIIIAASRLGKYIPGKVWFALGRMLLAKRKNIREAHTLTTVFLEAAFFMLAAVVLFGTTVVFVPAESLTARHFLPLAMLPVCLIVLYPPVFRRVVNFVLRKLHRAEIDFRWSFGEALALLGIYMFVWLCQGFGIWLAINSFFPLGIDKLPVLLGSHAVSWIVGFLVILAPAGLGVREGILTFFLSAIMPVPVAIIASLVARLWFTISEGLIAIPAAILARRTSD